MMTPAPRINPLQRLWLREIGIEKTWLGRDETASVPEARTQPGAARSAAAPPAAPASVPAPAAAEAARPAAPQRPSVRPPAPAAVAREAEPQGADLSPERAARIEQASLDELREIVPACTACGLCKGRRNAVFGTGVTAPRWMVVGEAPGEQEDRQGLPFVGRSGQLLDAMLASVGMSRDENVFIANVIKCRPPGNRNPMPEEIAACSPFLMRQIALLRPERILVVGRFAAQTLLGTDATIGSLRGRVHTLRSEGREIPVVVSYHPAYLLRSPSEKARSWQDLRLAVTG